MTKTAKQQALRDLRRIPGVGVKIAEDLWNPGFRSVSELAGRDPEDLYLKLCALAGGHVDRCMLYVFRCAVYYASHGENEHDPQLLKWWNWKDAPAVKGASGVKEGASA